MTRPTLSNSDALLLQANVALGPQDYTGQDLDAQELSGSPQLAVIQNCTFADLHRGLRLVWIRSIPGRLSGVAGAVGARIRMDDL